VGELGPLALILPQFSPAQESNFFLAMMRSRKIKKEPIQGTNVLAPAYILSPFFLLAQLRQYGIILQCRRITGCLFAAGEVTEQTPHDLA